MFIELTDHLRCPAPHDEAFLVLLPEEIDQRIVRRGTLGCVVCRLEVRLDEGIATFDGAPAPPVGGVALGGDALAVLAGVDGPGGYVALVGEAAARHADLTAALGAVSLVAVNPPAETAERVGLSVLRAPMLPLKARQLRAVILGPSFADAHWQREAARCVLPGLRVVGAGDHAALVPELTLLAHAGGWWVATPR